MNLKFGLVFGFVLLIAVVAITGFATTTTTTTVSNSPPTVSNIILDDPTLTPSNQIDLSAGTTRIVYCNATIEDTNGYNDIQNATAYVYRSKYNKTWIDDFDDESKIDDKNPESEVETSYSRFKFLGDNTMQYFLSVPINDSDLVSWDKIVISETKATDLYVDILEGYSGSSFNAPKHSTDSNTLAMWRFEGNSNDELGNYNGTDTNITYSSGRWSDSQAAYFGLDTSKIDLGDADDLVAINSSKTYELWFKVTGDTDGYNFIFTKNDGWDTYFVVLLYGDKVEASVNDGTHSLAVSKEIYFSTKQWYHLAVVHNSTGLYVYLNGDLVASDLGTVWAPNNSAHAYIGYDPNTIPDGTEYTFDGYIDDFVVYNYSRTASQIRSDFGTVYTFYMLQDNITSPLNISNVPSVPIRVKMRRVVGDNPSPIYMYKYTVYSNTITSPDNNYYYYTNCTLSPGYDTTKRNATCKINMYYYAEPGEWICVINTTDGSSSVGTANDTSTVNTLIALDTDPTLSFGSVSVGQTSLKVAHPIRNYGNTAIDIQVNGTDLTCSEIGTIPSTNVKYDLTDTRAFDNMLLLKHTPQLNSDFDLSVKTTDDANPSYKNLYWQIQVPSGVKGTCTGTIQFTAVEST